MSFVPCLPAVASAVLLTLPRAMRTALELGLSRDAALVLWQVWAGRLWLWRFRMLPGHGHPRPPWIRGLGQDQR